MFVEWQKTVPLNAISVIFRVERQTRRPQRQFLKYWLLQNRWKVAFLTTCQKGDGAAMTHRRAAQRQKH
ncbi:hypothetical protein EMB92_05485 [Bifidobacterium callitrichos]|uniref:Uncharacterized protein n=1 Tax=Bifidobacterium callitrichos TaxID=762209 RepID=A0A5M9ZC85_9BIFI|nr:hypothetical protein [Bifidobacterium callitrichos]KAA8816369.1 hypothetical protein EMB92_05485 [Bifidobacterium callitrichos]